MVGDMMDLPGVWMDADRWMNPRSFSKLDF